MNSVHLRQSIRLVSQADFSRSGGPGGQNVNKVNTKVILRLRLEDLDGLNGAELNHVKTSMASRLTAEGELVIHSREERSQHANLERAYSRLEALISAAACIPKHRRPTKPGRAAREKRLKTKKNHGQKKAQRSQNFEDQ
jgi:ribosome-associated protein